MAPIVPVQCRAYSCRPADHQVFLPAAGGVILICISGCLCLACLVLATCFLSFKNSQPESQCMTHCPCTRSQPAERRGTNDSTADLQGILQQRPRSPSTFEEVAEQAESQGAEGHAASAPEPLDAGLQRHFESIQSISDSTTLPQALRDLQRHVARLTGVHQLLDLLRCEVVSLIIGSSAEDVKMSSSGAHQEHYTAKYV